MPRPDRRAEALARAAQHSANTYEIPPEEQDTAFADYASGENTEQTVAAEEPNGDGIEVTDEQDAAADDQQLADPTDNLDDDEPTVDDELLADAEGDEQVSDTEESPSPDDAVDDDSAPSASDLRMRQMEEELAILRAQVGQQNTPPADDPPQPEVEPVDMDELRSAMGTAAADADVTAFAAAQQEYEKALVQQIARQVSGQVQQQTMEQQINNAAAMFTKHYNDIETDPVLSGVAQSRFIEKVQAGADPMLAATQVGDELRNYRNELSGQRQTDKQTDNALNKNAKQQLQARRQLKKQTVVDIPQATDRVDNTPTPGRREKTQQEMIQEMKKRRGQIRPGV